MDIADKISGIARRGHEQLDHITNEQATKSALVLPLLQALGYDPFDPSEVVPEFTADVGTKKGEKVDYAIRKNGELSILIECKPKGTDLSNAQYTQLFRYFSCTEAKFAILTNGFEYRFFSDLDAANKLDIRPFFIFSMDDFNDSDIEQLKKFTKPNFDVDTILSTANRLKYTNLAKRAIEDLLRDSPEGFVKYVIGLIYDGRQTRQIIEEFTPIVKDASSLYIKEQVAQRLKGALARNYVDDTISQPDPVESEVAAPEDDIITTQEEIDGYNIVRSILAEHLDVSRITMRDSKTYCAILLDNSNRKPLCKLHFNSKNIKRVGLFVDKKEERVEIEKVSDIYKYRDRLMATAQGYDL
ncbi:type I restriction endonuclease [Halotalea alkalilenta]|uniref:type I restriction endonuclease n=1 Tax=Halotalea alkalilenta TaxID=376489 RepID=UPI000480C3D9|nr:type I restriction endonuclease [Halotalea alkalilenta]